MCSYTSAVPVCVGEAGAPEAEIEVTPEMIDRGTLEISSYNLDFESEDDAVIRIYLAMAAVDPKRKFD